MDWLTWTIAIAIGLLLLVLKLVRSYPGGLRAGDFFAVKIPRRAEPPLAMGTRIEVMAALQKRGVAPELLKRFGSGGHDQEMLDLYWAAVDHEPPRPS